MVMAVIATVKDVCRVSSVPKHGIPSAVCIDAALGKIKRKVCQVATWWGPIPVVCLGLMVDILPCGLLCRVPSFDRGSDRVKSWPCGPRAVYP
jgi:hypothetical protein